MQSGTQAAAIINSMDDYAEAEAACHFDLKVLRVAVKELIVCLIMVWLQ